MEKNEKMLRLSKPVTELLTDLIADINDADLECINFPFLLTGILGAVTENGSSTELANFLLSQVSSSIVIDSALTTMSVDYKASLTVYYNPDNPEKFTEEISKKMTPDWVAKAIEEIKSLAEEPEPEVPVADGEVIKTELCYVCHDLFASLSFITFDDKELLIPVNKDVFMVYEKLLELVSKFDIEMVEIIHLTIALFMIDFKPFQKFFALNNLSYPEAKKFFSPDQISIIGTIPFELMEFLEIKNDKVDTSMPCEILSRDRETENLTNILLKKNKRNSVIVGDAGVGKSALVEKLTYDIVSGNCPTEFKNVKVIYLDVNALIAGTSYRGQAEMRIKQLVNFIESKNDIILFIDEVHTILGAGSCFEGEMDLANALKPLLARGDTRVIGATTQTEYEKFFKKDAALSRRFEPIMVYEPKTKNVYPMIKNKLKVLSDYHGVSISRAMVEYAIMVANAFAFDKKNPDKTLDLVDRAMVTAKRSGKHKVSKDSILKNFAIYFETWKLMSNDSKNETSYHECGHYIVGKASGKLTNLSWIAVSIMPAENYLGVTVTEENDNVPFKDINYFIDYIAYLQAGRVAENLFTNSFTEGAASDLNSATRMAFNVVTKLCMGLDSSRNYAFLNSEDYPMFSEKVKNETNEEVNRLVDAGFNRAKEILEKNLDILHAIVPVLMKKKIMSETELDKIWQDVVKKRNK